MQQRRLVKLAFFAWPFVFVASAQSPQGTIKQPASPDHSGEPFVVASIKTSYRFDADGTGSKTFQARIRVQTEGGVQQLGRIVLDYDSESERLKFTGRVIKPDGTVIPVPEDAAQDVSWPVSAIAPMYSDIRQKHILVPSLRPGDTIEYETQVDRFVAFAASHFWLTHDFESNAIVEEETLRIDVPSASYVNVKSKPGCTPEVEQNDGRRVYLWKSSHLEREIEPDASKSPKARVEKDTEPAVQLTTFRSWNEIGDWYAALEKEQRLPDSGIQSKVAALTKDATTDMAKLQAIYDFVAKDFRYVSLSFGIGRYQPHAASAILANQYGDCKDKHTLLAAMAQAAGLTARAALTSASRKVDETFPSPAQFDHVVSYVTVDGKGVWLDTTTELAPFGLLIAPVRGKSALVVNAAGKSELKTIPSKPLIPNKMVIRIDGAINDFGSLDAKASIAFSGDADVFLRLSVRSIPKAQWKDIVQVMAAGLGTFADVSDVEISDIADTRQPLEYRFRLLKQNYLNRFESNPQLALPLGRSNLQEPANNEGEKLVPLEATQTEYHARLTLPKRFEARLPLLVEQTRDFGEYRSKYTMEGTTLIADRALSLTVTELPATRLNEFRAFRRTVMSDSDQEVGVKFGGGVGAGEGGDAKTSELLDAAEAAYNNGKFQESVDLMERVVRSEPEHKTAYNDLGRAYLAVGDFARAEKALTKATEIDPFSPYAFNNLGRVFRAQRRFEEAEKAFRKQIEIDPLDKWAHENLGDMLLDQEKYSAAEKELEKAIAITPKNPRLYASLGHAQLSLAKVEEARGSFARAIDASPSPSIWNAVAFSLAENKTDLDRAQDYAESAVSTVSALLRNVRLDSMKPQELGSVNLLGACWDTLGWIYFRKGDMAAAERYLKSSWQLMQDNVVADHLGQLYERVGKKDPAVDYYAYAALDPHPAREGRKHLAALVGESKVASCLDERRDRPGALRTFDVRLPGGAGDASFFVILAPGNVVDDTRFISGDESLRPFADELKKIRFAQEFPDKRDTRIVRRGILSCERPVAERDPKLKVIGAPEQKNEPTAGSAARTCHFALIPSDQTSLRDDTPAGR
jgi:tetratricopeptide (TPR) repeat protein